MKKLLPYLLSTVVCTGPGCGTLQKIGSAIEYHIENLRPDYHDDAEKTVSPWTITLSELHELGARDVSEVRFWPGGYKTLKRNDLLVKELSGIYAGTIEVRKVDGRYLSTGEFTWNEEVIEAALGRADDGNMLVTRDELLRHLNDTRKKYAK